MLLNAPHAKLWLYLKWYVNSLALRYNAKAPLATATDAWEERRICPAVGCGGMLDVRKMAITLDQHHGSRAKTNDTQQIVASQMSQRIVDCLEIVDINIGDAEGPCIPTRAD